MSEEKIIEILKKLISWKGMKVEIRDYEIEAIKGLLDLYNKEKEKNASLQKEIKELKEKEKNLLKQLKDSEKELLEVTQNVVSKDKIKELEDNMILFTNDKEKFNRYKYTRDTLEKLLGE